MKKLLVMLITLSIVFVNFGFSQNQAIVLLEKLEERIMPNNFYCEYEMINKEPGRKDKVFVMKVWGKSEIGSLIEFAKPTRSKGIKMLQKDGNIWMYNPRSNTKKPIRLALKDSFQGSVFSNYDIADSRYNDDYKVSIKSIDGDIAILELKAKDDTKAYDKLIIKVNKKELIPLKYDFYTKSGLKIKSIEFTKFKMISGIKRPVSYVGKSFSGDEKVSIINVLVLEERNSLSDAMFTPQYMTK